jgi:small conductance mechanosensitive channel
MFENWETFSEALVVSVGPRVLGAVLTLAVGYVFVKVLARSLNRLFEKTAFDEVVETFLQNLLYWTVTLAVVVLALSQLGVNTMALSAGAAGAGVTLGLALKDTLSNMVAGLSIIARKLFTVGDFIEAAGTSGTVEGVTIWATLLRSPDDKLIIVPISNVAGGNITTPHPRAPSE